jgi:transposase
LSDKQAKNAFFFSRFCYTGAIFHDWSVEARPSLGGDLYMRGKCVEKMVVGRAARSFTRECRFFMARTPQTFTRTQLYQKLGISQATLHRWLKQAEEEGYTEQVKPLQGRDKREHLYTLPQLRWLAKHYQVELLSDEEAFEQESHDIKALRQEVEALRNALKETQAEVEVLKGELERLKAPPHSN